MTRKHYLHKLDSLRGIAAFLVVILHFQAYLTPVVQELVMKVTPFIHRSYILVDMFFILSGFVMSYTYTKKFSSGINFSIYKEFILKRFFKLYPLHLVTLLVLVFLHRGFFPLFDVPPSDFSLIRNNFHILTNLTLLQSSGLGWGDCFNCSSWNYPSWSISVEWISYFLVPSLMFILRKSKWASFSFVALLYLMFYLFVEVPIGNTDVLTIRGIIRCLIGMSFGISIFYHAYSKFEASNKLFYVIFTIAFLSLHFVPIDTICIVLMGLMLLVTSNVQATNFLDSKSLLWLGQRSFSIYMVHVIVQGVVDFSVRLFFDESLYNATTWVQIIIFIGSIGLVLMTAELSYRLIEKRLNSYLRDKFL
jgi:peptidoglycan/LPS O-acetylase OafA/YrhL